jgi:hypothetical protein
MTPHEQLPASYLASCEKFFKSIKQQAASAKQLTSGKLHDTSRIIKEKL